jgi:SH3-like domain-containing protein
VTVPLATAATVTAAVPPPGPQPKFTAPLSTPGDVCVVDVDKGETLKVRAGPGADQPLRYGYPAGACGVKITGACANGWCPVDYRNYRGWAEQKFLK